MKKISIVLRTALLEVSSGKIYRIMKLTNLLLLVTIFNVFGSETYSQYTQLNLNMKDVPIQAVLRAIEGQSEFFFIYSSKMIDVDQIVNIHVENKKITDVLDELLINRNIKYSVKDRQILLVDKETDAARVLEQNKRIGGTIIDESGKPMAGVNIQIEGTIIGAISDLNGKYSIDIPDENAVLVFSFIGYNTEKLSAAGKTIIDVKLVSSVSVLDEVVVVGYGTVKKSDLTGSVIRVNA